MLVVLHLLVSCVAGDANEPAEMLRTIPFEFLPFRNWLSTHRQRDQAEEEPIQTDRPSFTAAHTLVPQGWAQLESGYQFTHNRRGDRVTNVQAEPQLNLRIGLAEWLEFRNLWAGVSSIGERDLNTGIRAFQTTSSNFQTGFKIRATNESGWIPQSALITTVFLPTAGGASASGSVDPMIDYIYCWTVTEKLTFTGSTGAVFAAHDSRATNEYYQSLVLGGEWSDELSTYWEWYVTGHDSFHRDTSGQNMDGGILWRPWRNIQLDWRAGFGLDNSANDFFTGVGFSARY